VNTANSDDAGSLSVPTADALMNDATSRTGLENFGAPSFRAGLDHMLASIAAEPERFAQAGVDRLASEFVDDLSRRLRIEDWYTHHPETSEQKPERPLMITGLPRTGTSALASILSIEPAFRCLRRWEQLAPVPPPTLAGEADDPRRTAMRQSLTAMAAAHPEHMTMHHYELDATSEDVPLLRLEFRAQSFTIPAFAYHRWWRDQSMRAAYAYQRRVTQLLQSRRPPHRWLFKAPHYVFHLEDLLAAYPDARFVVTHRDPIRTLPSWASLLTSIFPPGSRERVSTAEHGLHIAEHQAIGMRRLIEARGRIGEDRFLDVHHHDFAGDPIGTLSRIYDFVGLPFSKQAQAQMRDWSQRNRPGAKGHHRYSAAQFGIDERAVREQFAFYTNTYNVRLEAMADRV
jgi:hypothetical protein